MLATYLAGAVGIYLALSGMLADPVHISWGTALAVGVTGILSFVRHSIFHRADAARMGWDLGRRNNFQIEVGLANLAWGSVALVAAIADWGLAVQAAMFLTMGGYMTAVAVMQWFWPGADEGDRRSPLPLIGLTSYAVALLAIGIWAMSLA